MWSVDHLDGGRGGVCFDLCRLLGLGRWSVLVEVGKQGILVTE